MYKPELPTTLRCPKCDTTVNVNWRMILTNPPRSAEVADSKPTACDIPGKPFLQQGWECPKCGAILAPHQHYCPFCSPSEYGRSNWVVTTSVRVPLEQYANPNPNTAISSDSITFTTSCDNIKVTI